MFPISVFASTVEIKAGIAAASACPKAPVTAPLKLSNRPMVCFLHLKNRWLER
jgi:hypothetical protein